MSAPIDATLFTSSSALELAGSRCLDCATVQFPAAGRCSHCTAAPTETIGLPREGLIWTFTVQRFAPKLPFLTGAKEFEPFAVGYVDLGEVLVETVLTGEIAKMEIGRPVHLVQLPVPGEDNLYTYGFSL